MMSAPAQSASPIPTLSAPPPRNIIPGSGPALSAPPSRNIIPGIGTSGFSLRSMTLPQGSDDFQVMPKMLTQFHPSWKLADTAPPKTGLSQQVNVAPPQSNATPKVAPQAVDISVGDSDDSEPESEDEAFRRKRTTVKSLELDDIPTVGGYVPGCDFGSEHSYEVALYCSPSPIRHS